VLAATVCSERNLSLMSLPLCPLPLTTPRPLRPGTARGFTLMEMLAVVVLITILAAIAIPLATKQMRDRRTHEAAQQVATLYQSARMRAMGRGSAVLVRYVPGAPATFELLEAQRGPATTPEGAVDAACAALPVSSCLTTNW